MRVVVHRDTLRHDVRDTMWFSCSIQSRYTVHTECYCNPAKPHSLAWGHLTLDHPLPPMWGTDTHQCPGWHYIVKPQH